MDDQSKAAFASASDIAKQLITLASGILVLEVTFAKNIMDAKLDQSEKYLLSGSWILFLLSIIAGVWSLLALTGSLGQGEILTPKTIYGSNIRIPMFFQIFLFLGGLALSVWFGIRGLK